MQCTIPPWIQSTAKPTQRGMWLGIFYTAIPVGTAIGYAYSAIIAESIGWQFAFWFEGLAMIPFVFFMFHIAKYFPCDNDRSELEKEQRASLIENEYLADSVAAESPNLSGLEDNMLSNPVAATNGADPDTEEGWRVVSSASAASAIVTHKPTIIEELMGVVKRPVWIWITVATAAQAAVLIGISTFGAAFVMGLGFFDTETEASTVFGIIISIAGMIATPFGGVMVDYFLSRPADDVSTVPPTHLNHPNEPPVDSHGHIVAEDLMNSSDPRHNSLALYRLSIFIAAFTVVGTFLLCICILIDNRGAFLFVLGVGSGVVLTVNPAMNMAVMLAVPSTYRSFAIAMNIVCLHAFGDVPAPVIIGLVKDTLAPNCVAAADADDDNIAASDQCRHQADGLRLTMFFSQLWLLWTILGGIMAAWYARKALEEEKARATPHVSSAPSNPTRDPRASHSSVGMGDVKSQAGLVLDSGSVTISALHASSSVSSPTNDANTGRGSWSRLLSKDEVRASINDADGEIRRTTSVGSGVGVSLTTVSPIAALGLATDLHDEDEQERLARQKENVDRLKRISKEGQIEPAVVDADHGQNAPQNVPRSKSQQRKDKRKSKALTSTELAADAAAEDSANL